jgi:hypothetical protein
LPHGQLNSTASVKPVTPNFGDNWIPNGKLLLRSFQLSLERLNSSARIAIPTSTLRGLLYLFISKLPFDKGFYLEKYPDIAAAYNAGQVSNLHEHFVRQGYFEGRLGIEPTVDEQFYLKEYPDVAVAIDAGKFTSAADHFIRGGATEGRFTTRAEKELCEKWMSA